MQTVWRTFPENLNPGKPGLIGCKVISLIISEMQIVTIKYDAKIKNLYSFKTVLSGYGT
jgi:hypothetical protein